MCVLPNKSSVTLEPVNGHGLASDSLVLFRNSQGVESRGTLIRLSRRSAVFEVYNPYSVVQLSEVLQDLRIRRGDRVIYGGRAVVSNLVSTGLLVIVSSALVDPWSHLIDLAPGAELRGEVQAFVDDWDHSHESLRPTYELAVSKIRHFLDELSLWLEEGETVVGIREPNSSPDLARQFGADVETVVASKLGELFGCFEQEARQVSGDELMSHKAFARRELHPLMLCSPFVHRVYTKPLGYAGDYEMVNMILGDPWSGNGTYAKLINSVILRSDTAQAHRNRILYLTQCLRAEAERVAKEGRVFQVANVGCGPAKEVCEFVGDPLQQHATAIKLIDFNKETLDYAMAQIVASAGHGDRNARFEFVHESIYGLLKNASCGQADIQPAYDMVYCAGLFDYLSDRICRRLVDLFYNWTFPGGLVVVTNVHNCNPIRGTMEHLADWCLVNRDEADMAAMASKYSHHEVVTEATGTNLFLRIRKPGVASQEPLSQCPSR